MIDITVKRSGNVVIFYTSTFVPSVGDYIDVYGELRKVVARVWIPTKELNRSNVILKVD